MADESVTRWIDDLKAGDRDAATKIVDRYFLRVMQLVQRRLPPRVRRAGDEEDVALSALNSLVGRMEEGQFEGVVCRDELWRVLVTISRRKAATHIERETAQKRGAGNVRGDSIFGDDPAGEPPGFERFAGNQVEPGAELELRETVERMVGFLQGLDDQALLDIAIWKSLDMPDTWIAEQLDCSTKTVERKRRRLREKALLWAEQEQ